MNAEEQKKKLLSDTASLSSESDHEGPPSNVSTTEIPPPSELKEEGIACSTVADPPPYSESVVPPAPAVGGPVWGQPPIATGATQQQATTVVVQPFPPSQPYPFTQPPPPNHLGLALFALFCCFFPLGIVALIKSLEVDKLHASGEYERARDASKRAHYWAMLSVKIGVALLVINVILGVAGGVVRVVAYNAHS